MRGSGRAAGPGLAYPWRMQSPARIVTAAVAAVEALALLGYAASIAVVALTTGIQGPSEVSSTTGVAVEIITYAVFGVGLAAIAWGRWRGHGWASVPFALAQVLALTVGIPLLTGADDGRLWGLGITAAAVIGLVGLVVGGRDPALDLTDAEKPANRH